MCQKANSGPRLALQNPDQIGIGHRCQRIIAFWRVRDQLGPKKEMAVVDGPSKGGGSRAKGSAFGAGQLHQQVGDRTDIALIGGIERRTIFEEDLPGVPRKQRPCRLRRHADGFARGDHPRLLRDHDSGHIAAAADEIGVGDKSALDSGSDQHGGRFHAARQIVRHHSEDERRHASRRSRATRAI